MEDIFLKRIKENFAKIDKVLMVTSGKGGVGKSLISVSLALASAERGLKTGLLDLDVHGPSVPNILCFAGLVKASKSGLEPPEVRGVRIMSVGLLSGRNPILLKGESKFRALLTLLALTNWGDLDILVIDMPPGTGDETVLSLRLLRGLSNAGALVVTTPSRVSIPVVAKLTDLLRGEGIRVLGLVENMSYLRCGDSVIRPFGELDKEFLDSYDLEILASLPIDPLIENSVRNCDFSFENSSEFKSQIRSLLGRVMGGEERCASGFQV